MRAAPAGMSPGPADEMAVYGSMPYAPATIATAPVPGRWAPPGVPGQRGMSPPPMSPQLLPMQPNSGGMVDGTRDWGYGNAPGAIPRGQILSQYGDLPGVTPEEARAKPHRPMTDDELMRYNCPPGTIIMASAKEISAGVGVSPIENQNPGSEQDQIAAYMMSRGMTPWTGPKQAVFLNGQPVPKDLFNHAPIPLAPDGYMGTIRTLRTTKRP